MSVPSTSALPLDDADELTDAEVGQLVELPGDPGAAAHPARKSRQGDATYHRVILGMCLAVLGLSLVMSVRERTQVLVPVLGIPLPELCHMRRYTGFDCPGCGLTRSFISIAHAQWRDAWRYNPGAFLLFPLMLVQIPLRAAQLWRLRRGEVELQTGWVGRIAVFAVVGALFAQWVVRQLGVGL